MNNTPANLATCTPQLLHYVGLLQGHHNQQQSPRPLHRHCTCPARSCQREVGAHQHTCFFVVVLRHSAQHTPGDTGPASCTYIYPHNQHEG
jgi:hypothetical protein